MKIIQLIDEDFVNYKDPCMVIGMPYCSFKCDKECGKQVCQNSTLANSKILDISIEQLIIRYLQNPITKAICFQGLEPFDSWEELLEFITLFRQKSSDIIIIYTGYSEYEISDEVFVLTSTFSNIIIKYGRFIPGQSSHYDKLLGIKLASDNQYAVRY